MGFLQFGSNSTTKEYVTNNNSDERQIADNGGIAANSGGGDLNLSIVPDEAFQLAEFAIGNANQAVAEVSQSFQKALTGTLDGSRSEGAQLGETLIKLGIPALAMILIFGAFRK